jgi:hypothetical protein
MNYYEKYLKYKSKYNSLKLNIEKQNSLKKSHQLGGHAFADDSIVKIITGDFKDQYGTVKKSWKCSTEDELLKECKSNTLEKTFTVYSVSIPIIKIINKDDDEKENKIEYHDTLINLKDTDVDKAVMFRIQPPVGNYNPKKIEIDYKGPMVYFSTRDSKIGEYIDNKPFFNIDMNKSMLGIRLRFGSFPRTRYHYYLEDEIKLATKFNYVGQDVIIDINNTGVTDKNKADWEIHQGHRGKIKDIVDNPTYNNHYDITFEYIGPKNNKQSNSSTQLVNSCKVTIHVYEHLLVQYTKPWFWFHNKILTCLPETGANK